MSKLRIQQQLLGQGVIPGAENSLLVICMRLLARPRCTQYDAELHDYRLAKCCYTFIETQNLISLKLLQANLLIALYEISHAIYPAAYLTIGSCARLGHALGTHNQKTAFQMFPTSSWVAVEEARRTWWAVGLSTVWFDCSTMELMVGDPKTEVFASVRLLLVEYSMSTSMGPKMSFDTSRLYRLEVKISFRLLFFARS